MSLKIGSTISDNDHFSQALSKSPTGYKNPCTQPAFDQIISESGSRIASCTHCNIASIRKIPDFVPRPKSILTSEGPIQVGCYPEVIKMWMLMDKEIPSIYVLPDPLFREDDVNYGDIEFPIYWYAFVKDWLHKDKRVTLIGTSDQILRMRLILQETIFGPTQEILERDGHDPQDIKRVIDESFYFAVKDANGVPYDLDAFVNFIPFDAEGTARLTKDFYVKQLEAKDTFLVQDGEKSHKIHFKTSVFPKCEAEQNRLEAIRPKNFGISLPGTSSGFDRNGFTTSGIIWMAKKGMFIDPLAYPSKHLETMGIDPKDVPYVLITHLHGDHDAGLIPWILQYGTKIQLLTTRIIYESFLRKAKAITGRNLEKMVAFVELTPNKPVVLENGFTITSRNNFHSIPTIGFTVKSPKGKVLKFSGDTYLPDQNKLQELVKNKILTPERASEISNPDYFTSTDGMDTFHDAGIPPIHTSVDALKSHVKAIGKEPILVHTPKPARKGDFAVAETGDTYTYENENKEDLRYDALEAVTIAFPSMARDIGLDPDTLNIQTFKKDEYIVKQGELLDRSIFVIINGNVVIAQNGKEITRLGRGAYFGEQRCLLDTPRLADVQADSNGALVRFSEDHAFTKLLKKNQRIKNIAERFISYRETLMHSEHLQGLPLEMTREFAGYLEKIAVKQGTILPNQRKLDDIYIIQEGMVRDEQKNILLGKGKIIGVDTHRNATVTVESEEASLLKLAQEDYETLAENYPRLGFLFNK